MCHCNCEHSKPYECKVCNSKCVQNSLNFASAKVFTLDQTTSTLNLTYDDLLNTNIIIQAVGSNNDNQLVYTVTVPFTDGTGLNDSWANYWRLYRQRYHVEIIPVTTLACTINTIILGNARVEFYYTGNLVPNRILQNSFYLIPGFTQDPVARIQFQSYFLYGQADKDYFSTKSYYLEPLTPMERDCAYKR